MANDQEEKLREYVQEEENANNSQIVGTPIVDTSNIKKPWEKTESQISLGNRLGWQELPIKEFPTQGMFYPEGTKIAIRAANSGEIRHWSSLNETNLMALDDMLNYILERCVTVKFPDNSYANWKDIKEIDRFYLILAIRELTFVKGESQLQVKISENKKIDVSKEMIDYITFDDKLLRYYDDVERCFNLKFKTKETLRVYVPSVGVVAWIKAYVLRKRQEQQSIDEDFANIAPFIIDNWRGLNEKVYEQFVQDSFNWTPLKISAMAKIKDIFIETINPVVKFLDDGGAERTAPLTFLGGFKSILLISDPFGELE